jgi:hypothetical protein
MSAKLAWPTGARHIDMVAKLSGQSGDAEKTSTDPCFVFTQEQDYPGPGSGELGDICE